MNPLEETLALLVDMLNKFDVHELETKEPMAVEGNDNEYIISIKRVKKD